MTHEAAFTANVSCPDSTDERPSPGPSHDIQVRADPRRPGLRDVRGLWRSVAGREWSCEPMDRIFAERRCQSHSG